MPKNIYLEKQQLSNGVYVVNDGCTSWGYELNHNFEILNALLNRKTLTITSNGEVLGTYDSSEDKAIDIPVDHYTLTIKHGDQILGSFDNTDDLNIDIPKEHIGSLTLSVNGRDIGTFKANEDKTLNIEFTFATNDEIDDFFK